MKRAALLDDYQGEALALPYWQRLRDRVQLDHYRDTLADEEALVRRLAPYAILIAIRERTRFPGSLLNRLPALELLAITGRNSGHVDVAAATARGVLVAETSGSSVAAIELTLGLIIATVRRIAQEDRALREGRWQTSIGLDLAGKTMGVVGLGRIGSRVAAFGQFLGMRVLAWGPTLTPERAAAAGVAFTPLEQLMAGSDVVTLHTRLSSLTRGMITARHLALMKPTAYFINTARGPLVDEAALVDVLRRRRIAGAGLDVFDVEPLPAGHPLLGLDNVVLTPHIGYVTREAYDAFFGQAVENIEAFLEGKIPARAINPEARDRRGDRAI
jgi:phosphoglycerate dehydrogenase-like enzyme